MAQHPHNFAGGNKGHGHTHDMLIGIRNFEDLIFCDAGQGHLHIQQAGARIELRLGIQEQNGNRIIDLNSGRFVMPPAVLIFIQRIDQCPRR